MLTYEYPAVAPMLGPCEYVCCGLLRSNFYLVVDHDVM